MMFDSKSFDIGSGLRAMYANVVHEPLPVPFAQLLAEMDGAAALTGTERGECSPENNGGPNGEPDSREIPRPGEAPHNRFPVKTPLRESGSRA